ncbi:SAM-dependent methyltransferase [Spongiibacter sp. KMU-158]|uniref:tRNA (guanine(46)-N(7))-methyltransferase n=1 Tax=Spongiibacter pelagi TaxID=2760804 RepID=A0A927GVK8_9GAMM|nr:SAM-dependent methyltransferase [Spongiibacter pelagi]MBD2857987.1 SAM-dependent methyltransferase [Spongiibacter pelagi]
MKKTNSLPSSRRIVSNQTEVHANLEKILHKHLAHTFRKPYAQHNLDAFQIAAQWLAERKQPLILDSFCGVGESTAKLAEQYPDCAVIGIDKSAARLDKHAGYQSEQQNYLLIQADVEDFWRLAVEAGWQPLRHFLLYPNPWPKSDQIKLRIHGSPVFPALLKLGGEIELRSNWALYVDEFATALRLLGVEAAYNAFLPETIITPFERKYLNSGQTLWRCQAHITAGTINSSSC